MMSPYLFKGNNRRPFAGFGVAERGFIGTAPGAPSGLMVSQAGAGGVAVRRDIHSTFGTYMSGGPGTASIVPLGGLTGGLYQTGMATVTALSEYVQGQSYNGSGPAPPNGSFNG